MSAPDITFSLKPFTLKDQALLQRMMTGDSQATIDLIVRRSDPQVTEAIVGDLTVAEATEVMNRLGKSLESVQRLNSLVGDTLKDPG